MCLFYVNGFKYIVLVASVLSATNPLIKESCIVRKYEVIV